MKKHQQKNILFKIFIPIIMLLAISFYLNFQTRPIVNSIIINKAKTISTDIINSAVLEELSNSDENYSDLVDINRLSDGSISAVSTDVKKINSLKSKLNIAIQKKFYDFNTKYISISLGTLSGIDFFNGLGPDIPLTILLSGNINTNLESNFSEAGINQTKHQITLNVTTRISAFAPGYPTYSDINTNMILCETIIVGKVPNFYSQAK